MKCFRQCVSLHNYSGVEEITSLYIVAAKSLETFLKKCEELTNFILISTFIHFQY